MNLEDLLDEADIRRLAITMTHALNVGDPALFRSVWTDDAIWHIPNLFTARGAQDISAKMGERLNQWEWRVQMSHPGVLSIQGDSATGQHVVHELGRRITGAGLIAVGTYHDEYRRTEAGWRVSSREWSPLYSETPEFPEIIS